ncbi:MAG: STAS domain-containing protein [Desulfovibrio sp.]|jgi:anti-anti-sigma factor|nr:STAS domain-containing protein [Desulfovibrio sp.]
MNISIEEKSPESTVISLAGRMDAGNASEFNGAFDAILEKRPSVLIINLGGLQYISSAGLRSVLTLIKAAKATGTVLKFCGMQPMVADIFKVSGFSSMLSIFDTLDAALAGES